MEASKKKQKTLVSFFSKPSTNAPPNPKSEVHVQVRPIFLMKGNYCCCRLRQHQKWRWRLICLPNQMTKVKSKSQSNLQVKLVKQTITIQNQNGPVSGLKKCGIARKMHFLG
ncbi:hypothetical protein AVEN_208609-1 [Araneus ventricosus]|uniref:Uncharacterized protein n=1 Tax=Araneus ventricosus TaxID=182803 RepID=A0A4Y2REY7_ARAVE|nr:hypothetical protein AVEN_208609-1 [Araneus ventricosus]